METKGLPGPGLPPSNRPARKPARVGSLELGFARLAGVRPQVREDITARPRRLQGREDAGQAPVRQRLFTEDHQQPPRRSAPAVREGDSVRHHREEPGDEADMVPSRPHGRGFARVVDARRGRKGDGAAPRLLARARPPSSRDADNTAPPRASLQRGEGPSSTGDLDSPLSGEEDRVHAEEQTRPISYHSTGARR